jgi:spore germination protein GerM
VNGKERLYPVSRGVSAESPARAALEELISGELPAGCTRPLPAGTTLRGIRADNGLVTADFSPELASNFQGGSDNEGVAVYAIVNTLTSLPGVKQVQILVDGKPIDSIGGHLDVSGPLGADGELVVK